MTDDQSAIERVLSGDREAFRELVAGHQSAVCATIAALWPGRGDFEDLSQETFLAAFRHLASFDAARGSFRTWLLAIARNLCRTANSRTGRIRVELNHDPIDERTPERLASEAECFRKLDAGLAELPEEQRLVFVLVELQGLSYEETAEIAGVPIGTIKSRLFRAKEGLREALRPFVAAGLPIGHSHP